MEFLGYVDELPSINENKKWDYFEIVFPNEDSFNDATSKIFKGVKKDACRFVIADTYNDRYFLDLLDVRYNSKENSVRIWPHDFWPVRK